MIAKRKVSGMAYYWNNETDAIETTKTIRESYEEFRNDWETFDEYLNGCMWWNNGALTPLRDYITNLKHRRDRIERLMSNDTEYLEMYDDEYTALTALIAELETY